MITSATNQGLVVAVTPQATMALDELATSCGWPVLLRATPRSFRRQLLLGVPEVSLFWLDDEHDVTATADLLSWLRSYQPEVRRVAVGYRLMSHVEVAVRSGGAQMYVSADRIPAILDGPIAEWLRGEVSGRELLEPSFSVITPAKRSGTRGTALHSTGPP